MVLRGDSSAYATLVGRYQAYVFTLVLRQVNSREVAEELAQDVFVKAYRSLADFKGTSKFSTWLFTIAHYTCLSYLRKRPDGIYLPGDAHLIRVAEGAMTTQDERLEQAGQAALLAKAIAQLPDADAEIISLFYLGAQSLAEIGTITGQTTGNVKVKLFRARNKLRQIVATKFRGELR